MESVVQVKELTDRERYRFGAPLFRREYRRCLRGPVPFRRHPVTSDDRIKEISREGSRGGTALLENTVDSVFRNHSVAGSRPVLSPPWIGLNRTIIASF